MRVTTEKNDKDIYREICEMCESHYANTGEKPNVLYLTRKEYKLLLEQQNISNAPTPAAIINGEEVKIKGMQVKFEYLF